MRADRGQRQLQCAHGYVAAYVFDNSDSLANIRAALKSAAVRSLPAQKKWVAMIVLRASAKGARRDAIDDELVKCVKNIIEGGKLTAEFARDWYEKIVRDGELRDTFSAKRLSKPMMELYLDDEIAIPTVPELFP